MGKKMAQTIAASQRRRSSGSFGAVVESVDQGAAAKVASSHMQKFRIAIDLERKAIEQSIKPMETTTVRKMNNNTKNSLIAELQVTCYPCVCLMHRKAQY